MMSLVSAYKRSRANGGNTLAAVASHSGLQVANLSTIENGKRIPRVDTLEKAIRATGKKFVPVSNLSASAAEISEEIETELARGRVNDLFRFVVQLADNLAAADSVEDFYALVIEPAVSTGNQDWDSAIEAVTQFRANQRGWPTPSWCNKSILQSPISLEQCVWVGVPSALGAVRGDYQTAPEFTSRGIFVALDDLESI